MILLDIHIWIWLVQGDPRLTQQHQNYYYNLSIIGIEYEDLDYNQALPFFLMLPQSLINL